MFALRTRAPFDDEIRRRLTRNCRQVVAECETVIAEGIETGAFSPVDPEATASSLITAVDGARNTDLTLDVDGSRQTVFGAIDRFVVPALTVRYDPQQLAR